jgi:excisionase family DNA binding protein
MPDEFLTVREIAELLKLNQQTVRNMIDRGELGHVRIGQRRVRVRQSELDAFLAAGASDPQPPRADPWQAVSEAATEVLAAVREQNRAELERAITSLAEAAQQIRRSETTCRICARSLPPGLAARSSWCSVEPISPRGRSANRMTGRFVGCGRRAGRAWVTERAFHRARPSSRPSRGVCLGRVNTFSLGPPYLSPFEQAGAGVREASDRMASLKYQPGRDDETHMLVADERDQSAPGQTTAPRSGPRPTLPRSSRQSMISAT